MPKDVRCDPKYFRAKRNLGSLERMAGSRKALRKMCGTAAQRMIALMELRLPFPIVRKLGARILVRRILEQRIDELRGLAEGLLQQWSDTEDPDHEVNREYRSLSSDIYSEVSQRHRTQPHSVPTNMFRGQTMDIRPVKAETLRLYQYGTLEIESKEDADSGIEAQVVPSSKNKKKKKWEFKKKNGVIPKWSPFFCPRSEMYPSIDESDMPSFDTTMSNMTPSSIDSESAVMDQTADCSFMSFCPTGYHVTSTPFHQPESHDNTLTACDASFYQ